MGHGADVRAGAPAARHRARCSSSARSRCSASTASRRGSADGCSATGRRSSGSSRRSRRSRSSSTATRSAGASSSSRRRSGSLRWPTSRRWCSCSPRRSSSSARSRPAAVPDAVLAGLLLGAAGALEAPEPPRASRASPSRTSSRAAGGRARLRSRDRPGAPRPRPLEGTRARRDPGVRARAGATGRGLGAARRRPHLDRYFDLDFEHWREQMDQLREFFWSARLAQWAPLAGLARRAPRAPRRDRGAARRLARRVPRREGLLAPGGHPGEHVLAAAHAGLARVPPPLRVDPAARPDARAPARRADRAPPSCERRRSAGSSSPPS